MTTKNTTKFDVAKLSPADLAAAAAAFEAAKKAEKEAERKARTQRTTEVPEALAALQGHTCTVTGGRKFPEGTQIDITKVGVSRYGSVYARGYKGSEEVFIDPKFLKRGKPLSDLRATELQTVQDEVIRFRGVVRHESEKALVIRPYPLYQGFTVAKSNVTVLAENWGDTDMDVFEVPAWAIRQKVGPAMYDLLKQESAAHKLDEIE